MKIILAVRKEEKKNGRKGRRDKLGVHAVDKRG